MRKNNYFLIAILIIFVVFISAYVVYNKILIDEDEIPVGKDDNQDVLVYKEYKKNDEVTFSDGSKWVVIEDSSKESDYVTLIKKEVDDIISHDIYFTLVDEIFNNDKLSYNDTNLKKYVDKQVANVPVELKEVNGYEARLITLEEIMSFDNNWEYNETYDYYIYVGDKTCLSNMSLFGNSLTMTSTKCTEGKCLPFYVVSLYERQNEDMSFTTECHIVYWASGLPQIQPVINVYKKSITPK